MTPAELADGARLLAAVEQEHLKADGRMVVDANGNVLAMMNLAMHPKLAEANAAAIAWLRTNAAELIADAGRYQWLRDKTRKDVGFTLTDIGSRIAVRNFQPDYLTLDAAIDAARASGTEWACS